MPDGPGGFAQDYSCPALLRIPLGHLSLRVRNCHPLWLNFPGHSSHDQCATARSYYPSGASLRPRFGLFPGRSPLLGESLLFSLPLGTKMFQFPRFASVQQVRIITLQVIGLSHSEIRGSRVTCTYPRLIAAYHVLHRLREPRHPPDALTCFRHKIEYVASASTLPAANYSLFAHTFSCKLRVVKKHSVNNLKSLLTVLCVNMSKISRPSRIIADWLRRSAFSQTLWRITDSNR